MVAVASLAAATKAVDTAAEAKRVARAARPPAAAPSGQSGPQGPPGVQGPAGPAADIEQLRGQVVDVTDRLQKATTQASEEAHAALSGVRTVVERIKELPPVPSLVDLSADVAVMRSAIQDLASKGDVAAEAAATEVLVQEAQDRISTVAEAVSGLSQRVEALERESQRLNGELVRLKIDLGVGPRR